MLLYHGRGEGHVGLRPLPGGYVSVYAVSDIHGCYDQFMAVLGNAQFDSACDRLYVLGDLIDRGPQIDLCARWLVDNRANAQGSPVRFLMGNHEEMASWAFSGAWSRFRFDEVTLPSWEINGGTATVRQFEKLDPSTVDAFQRIVTHAPKAATLRFDRRLVLLCHAGIRPAEPEAEVGEWLIQSAEDLMWIGVEWYGAPEQPPFDVVSGHTPTIALCQEPELPGCPDEVRAAGAEARMMHWGRKHVIDCGCVFGGKMGLLRLDDWREFYA